MAGTRGPVPARTRTRSWSCTRAHTHTHTWTWIRIRSFFLRRSPWRTPFPRWDQAYAVLRIPRIGLTAPVAEGTGKGGVLDRGYVGHYTRTAQAGQAGNFALAGHRNTHGEPFRRIDRLRRGDRITVETRDAVYTYTVDQSLARTAPSDSGVIAPVPRSDITTSAGYGEPGYYLTLTTCTPEFSSRYRLVVWGSSPPCAPGSRPASIPGRGDHRV